MRIKQCALAMATRQLIDVFCDVLLRLGPICVTMLPGGKKRGTDTDKHHEMFFSDTTSKTGNGCVLSGSHSPD